MARVSAAEAKFCALIVPDYEVDHSGLLIFRPRSAQSEDRTKLAQRFYKEIFCTTTTQVWRVATPTRNRPCLCGKVVTSNFTVALELGPSRSYSSVVSKIAMTGGYELGQMAHNGGHKPK